VYRTSIEILAAMPDVIVENFDDTSLDALDSLKGRIWNFPAARALQTLIERFRPTHVWVHNYHNNLSAAILPVIMRQRRRFGFATYWTCHDFFPVFHDPAMIYRSGGRIVPVPLSDLGHVRTIMKRSSAKGLMHDVFKKAYWYMINWRIDPPSAFDMILCPSPFMQQVLEGQGIDRCVHLANPMSSGISPTAPRQFSGDTVKLAFAGRISAEKGLDEFIALTDGNGFRNIATFTIFGDGDERPRLEQKYQRLVAAGKVKFAGKLPHQQLFAALCEQDALVLPSVWYENAPLVIVEAAALGLPILVHEIGSLVSFGDDLGNKILYQNNPASFAAALGRLLAHLHERRDSYNLAAYSSGRYAENLRAAMLL
jgi:glycosyltransferase involved in cell wall biosynthesis